VANIQISLPVITDSLKTYLSQDYTSGTGLEVASSSGFVSGMYIIVGEIGQENTEVTNLTASPPDNVDLTVTALKFSHAKGTPIYYTNWDKYSLEYRTSSANAWNIYSGMPSTLSFEALYTEYRDSAATSTYGWRYRYYSSEKSAYSDYSDIITSTGWARNTVGYMVREIRKIVNDLDSKTVTDTEIIRFLNAAQDKIYTLYDRWWFLFKKGTSIPSVAGQKAYALPTDFGRMHSVQFEYVSGSNDITYDLEPKSIIEFDYDSRDNNSASNDNVREYAIYPGDTSSAVGYLYVWPKPLTAGLNIIPRYFKVFTDLTTYSSATEVPIPDILEDYAIGRILAIRKEDDKASEYDSMYKEQVQLLKFMQRKNANPMRSLWNYQGVNARKRLFGTRNVYNDTVIEQNW
jgi:hypothetical protein